MMCHLEKDVDCLYLAVGRLPTEVNITWKGTVFIDALISTLRLVVGIH